MADEIITKLGYDLARFPALTTKFLDPRSRVFDIAVRARTLDDLVRRFISDHPDAVVLDLGAGLDTRMFRVDPPPTVTWYDIDFPEIIGLRARVVPATRERPQHRARTSPTRTGSRRSPARGRP